MPAKVYLDAPPDGDFRAMPARGEGFAILKWVTSFPGNSGRGLPVVTGALLLSSAETGELLAIARLRRRSPRCAPARRRRSRRSARRRRRAKSVGHHRLRRERRLGRALPGRRRLRPGRLRDARAEVAEALAAELGWRAGDRAEAAPRTSSSP